MDTIVSNAPRRQPTAGVVRFFEDHMVRPLVRWRKRNELYREMMALDERILDDLGITRYQIPDIVANAFRDEATNVAVLRAKGPRRPAEAPTDGNDHHRPLAA